MGKGCNVMKTMQLPWLRGNSGTDGLLLAALVVLALMAPLPLYLLALVLFGLPHVLWELAWIRRHGARRFPAWWWLMLAAPLVLQALGRLAVWAGWLGSSGAVAVDLATLAAALVLVAALPGRGWRHRATQAAAVLFAGGLCLALRLDSLELALGLLVLLSLAHNFTPLGLAQLAPDLPEGVAKGLRVLCVLPLLVAVLPATGFATPETWNAGLVPWLPPEVGWLAERWPGPGWLSAVVLAQCLHYYAVLRIFPQCGGPRLLPGRWLTLAVLATVLLAATYLIDFRTARQLYGVAAGVHAWLEWPLLLCLAGAYCALDGEELASRTTRSPSQSARP